MKLNVGQNVEILFDKTPKSYLHGLTEGFALYEDFNGNYHVHSTPRTFAEIEDTCIGYMMHFLNIDRVYMCKADYERLASQLGNAERVCVVPK